VEETQSTPGFSGFVELTLDPRRPYKGEGKGGPNLRREEFETSSHSSFYYYWIVDTKFYFLNPHLLNIRHCILLSVFKELKN